MTSPLNIRNAAHRAMLSERGWTWATVVNCGSNKGRIKSKHARYEHANRAAKDRAYLSIVEIASGESF